MIQNPKVLERIKQEVLNLVNADNNEDRKLAVRAIYLLRGDEALGIAREFYRDLAGRNISMRTLKAIGEIGEFKKQANKYRRGRISNPLGHSFRTVQSRTRQSL